MGASTISRREEDGVSKDREKLHSAEYSIGLVGIAIALYFITDRPAYSFLFLFGACAVGNAFAWFMVVREKLRRGEE